MLEIHSAHSSWLYRDLFYCFYMVLFIWSLVLDSILAIVSADWSTNRIYSDGVRCRHQGADFRGNVCIHVFNGSFIVIYDYIQFCTEYPKG